MVADGTIPPRTDPASFPEQDPPSFSDVTDNLVDAWAGVQAYLAVQVARLRAIARNFVLLAVLAVFAGAIGLSIVISSAVLLMVGIADALGALLGNRPWAGDLIVGVGVIGGGALTAYLVIMKMMNAISQHNVSTYEKKKIQN